MKKLVGVLLSAILGSVMFGCSSPATTSVPESDDGYTIKFGNLQDVTETDLNGKNILVIKAKIKGSYNDKATVDQNYFNVEDLIKNQGADQYDEIQYWAVADMSGGSEQKVISFTLPADLIQAVADGSVPANQIGQYATDLWIHQSLR